MNDNNYSRRKFIRKYLFSGTLLGGALLLGINPLKSLAEEFPSPALPDEDAPGSASQQVPKKKAPVQKAKAPVKKKSM